MLNQSTTPPIFGDPRLPVRFWAKVNENGPIPAHRPDLGPCWQWTACQNRDGYGQFLVGSRTDGTRKTVLAHRWAYEHLIGPVAEGLEPDHLCRNPTCVCPSHIEPVTHAENVLRGDSPRATRARGLAKTHCPQGHPYDEANTYIYPRSERRGCRACHRQGMAKQRSGMPS